MISQRDGRGRSRCRRPRWGEGVPRRRRRTQLFARRPKCELAALPALRHSSPTKKVRPYISAYPSDQSIRLTTLLLLYPFPCIALGRFKIAPLLLPPTSPLLLPSSSTSPRPIPLCHPEPIVNPSSLLPPRLCPLPRPTRTSNGPSLHFQITSSSPSPLPPRPTSLSQDGQRSQDST